MSPEGPMQAINGEKQPTILFSYDDVYESR